MDKVELEVFGKDAAKLREMNNPQFDKLIIKSVEGRTVVTVIIKDCRLGWYSSKPERVDQR